MNVFSSPIIKRALVYGCIGVLAFSILMFFSQPNRLAHDQIDHAMVLLKAEQPTVFTGDYLLGDEKYRAVDNFYSFRFLKWLSRWLGSDEVVRWFLIPIIFILFTVGMFEVLFYFTRNELVSLSVAFLSNIHLFPIFVGEWGLPGPTDLDPWIFVFAFYPLLFLLFYQGIIKFNHMLLASVFMSAGLLGNLHIISVFNIIGIFLITYFFLEQRKKKALFWMLFFGVVSVLASVPILVRFASEPTNHVTTFDPASADAWDAIRLSARHVTFSGKLEMVKIWLTYQWYFIWPALVVFGVVMRWGKKFLSTVAERFFRPFSFAFIAAVFLFNGGFTLVQLFRLYVLHQTPMFNEPRGVHFMYILFFISLGLILKNVYDWVKKKVSQKTIAVLCLAGVVASVGVLVLLYPTIRDFSIKKTRAPYTFLTCDSEMYRQLRFYTSEQDTILADPALYGAMRMCTRRPVAVQSRDRALAYTLGSDKMMEWYDRFRAVTRAYERGGEELVAVAKKYRAQVIVSRNCIDIPKEEVTFSKKLLHPTLIHQGCFSVLKPYAL